MSSQTSHQWLPWQTGQKQHLLSLLDAGRLPHAWLFHGPAGTGKDEFGHMFAWSLLCSAPHAHEPCGSCHSCQLYLAGNHPDLLYLQAEEGKQIIPVDKVRQCVEFMQKTANQGGRRIAILPNAHHMNVNASNALLKTLEEPPPNTLLILLSSQPGLLLATIRSRCQSLLFPVPRSQDAKAWLDKHHPGAGNKLSLSLAGGSPLLALRYTDEDWLHLRQKTLEAMLGLARGNGPVVGYAQSLGVQSLHDFCDILLMTVHQLQKQVNGAGDKGQDAALTELAGALPAAPEIALDIFYRKLLLMRKDLQRGLALNLRLAVETLLLDWKNSLSNSIRPGARA